MTFDSLAAVNAALASPAGDATTADLGNFASDGINLLMFETREV